MGFRIVGFFFLLLFFHQLHLLLAYQHSNNTQFDTEFEQRQNASEKGNPQKITSKEVSVNRRGGGGGGHGGGGHGGGGGGHGNGGGHGEGGQEGHGGGAVIPLYAAGAGGYHGRHHGSNTASPGNCGLSYLVISILISIVFVYCI